ncbi:hypothetical protein NDU88_005088 [Pleurodeles waltl]|uniref:Uncharacterized protein n=1 Tax=Pleurodeles waltl TaxID=8319 RepID=A0AAV7X057_PLEWA|nr:hypothetical protein NDU88_005088 [Pleurodeles waltl]
MQRGLCCQSDGAPLMRAFMEQLFESLLNDLATLKREIAADIKDLKREGIDLGQRVDTVEQAQDARKDELDCHRRELLTLQDKNQELQYQIEDLENRSRRSNIRIKGVPTQAIAGPLEDFVVHLFLHVAPALKEQNIVLDRTHRAGRPARVAGQAKDILTLNDTPETNFATLWDTLKAVVRGQFIAARQNALRHDKRQQLEVDIGALEETHRQCGSLAVRRQLAIQRKQLRALDEDKAEYALLRTKQKFYTGENRAGRLPPHRLRTKATERRVGELRLPDGTLTCQEELIRQQF